MDRIYSNQSCCSCSEEGKIFHIDQRSMSVFQQQCRPHLQALFLLLLLFENCSCLLFKSSNQTSVTTAVDAFWVSDLSWSSSSFNWRLLPRYVLCTLGASCHKHQSNAIFFMAAWIFLHSLGWHSVKAVSWFMSVVSFWGHALIMAVTRQRQMRSSQSKRARREFQPSCPPIFYSTWIKLGSVITRPLNGGLCVFASTDVRLSLLWVLLSLRHEDAMRLSVYIGASYHHMLDSRILLHHWHLSRSIFSLPLFFSLPLLLSLFIFLAFTLY